MLLISPDGMPWVHLDIVQAMEQLGDADALTAMLAMLQDSLAREVPQIAQLLANTDVKAASLALHSLKGCMPIFCHQAVCDQLAQVELLSKSASSEDVAQAYVLLVPELQQLQVEIEQYLVNTAQ